MNQFWKSLCLLGALLLVATLPCDGRSSKHAARGAVSTTQEPSTSTEAAEKETTEEKGADPGTEEPRASEGDSRSAGSGGSYQAPSLPGPDGAPKKAKSHEKEASPAKEKAGHREHKLAEDSATGGPKNGSANASNRNLIGSALELIGGKKARDVGDNIGGTISSWFGVNDPTTPAPTSAGAASSASSAPSAGSNPNRPTSKAGGPVKPVDLKVDNEALFDDEPSSAGAREKRLERRMKKLVALRQMCRGSEEPMKSEACTKIRKIFGLPDCPARSFRSGLEAWRRHINLDDWHDERPYRWRSHWGRGPMRRHSMGYNGNEDWFDYGGWGSRAAAVEAPGEPVARGTYWEAEPLSDENNELPADRGSRSSLEDESFSDSEGPCA